MTTQFPSHMRAVQYSSASGGLERNVAVNEKTPLPAKAKSLPKDSVLVKVGYSSLNPVDVKFPESFMTYLIRKPAIPGTDYAGTVVDSKLAGIKAGDKAYGFLQPPEFGALAEYVVVTGINSVNKVPTGVSLSDAAAIGVVGLTAYQSIEPYVKKGDRVLINGASGGCGTMQIQIAKLLGCHVTAVCSGGNAELCRDLGADDVIDYKTTNLLQHVKKQASNGERYDFVCDNMFNNLELYWQAHHYTNSKGRFLTIAGSPSLGFMRDILSVLLYPRFLGGGQRPFKLMFCKEDAAIYTKLSTWMAEGKLRPVIERTIDMDDIAEGYVRMKSGRTRGKIVVKIAKS